MRPGYEDLRARHRLALGLASIRANLIAACFVDTGLSASLLGDQLDGSLLAGVTVDRETSSGPSEGWAHAARILNFDLEVSPRDSNPDHLTKSLL